MPNISAMTGPIGTPRHKRMSVVAVGREDRVVVAQVSHDADRDRLLADVQVEEPADPRGAVQLDAALLEPADAQHLPVELARPVAAIERVRVRRS